MVNLTINGISVTAAEGTTILDAAKSVGIEIPTLCYLKGINEIGACRVCVVEVEGIERCVTACNNTVEQGMVVSTNSRKARTTRATNVKLILSQHDFRCASCVRSGNCSLQKIANDLDLSEIPYQVETESLRSDPTFPLIRDSKKCIKCMRCVQVCDKVQNQQVWDVVNTGARTTVDVSAGSSLSEAGCVLCGQCLTHCPVGALRERSDVERVIEVVDRQELTTIVQIAPAVRTAWGEGMGIPREIATAGRLVASLRKIGFHYIFDTTFSADLTIMEEGSELLERLPEIRSSGLPMFTSCCPGWVRFLSNRYPQLKDRLSTAKSPQQMFGAISKSYYAELTGINPSKIFCVSIMPCIAKKDERTWDGGKDVDAVLTTREVERLLKSYYIRPELLEEETFDAPLGTGTGAGVIFGTTGGVMEAALRSAYFLVTGSNADPDAFCKVRGLAGWKEAQFDLAGDQIKVAVASGLSNAGQLIEAILNHEVTYDFVEIMACPGGCVSGGGQPIHDGLDYTGTRAEVLYGLDQKNALRYSHDNPEIIRCYQDYLGRPLSDRAHELLHTTGIE